MKKFIFLLALTVSYFITLSQTGKEFYDSPQTLKFSNGVIKEQGDWKNNLIVGKRKLYNEAGQLIEQHFFGEDSITLDNGKPVKGTGIIKTYYPSGAVYMVIPVFESIRQMRGISEYDLKIDYDIPIVGYFDDGKKRFEFTLTRPFTLNSSDIDVFSKTNQYFPDVFDESKDLIIDGLTTEIKYFNKDGTIQAQGSIKNGKKSGAWKYYYPNGKIKSTGEYLLHKKKEPVMVGGWKHYSESGTLLKEEEFYKSGNDKKFKFGDHLNNYTEYDNNGKTKLIIRYPLITETNLYADTIEEYYDNGQLKFKYDDLDKATLYTGQPYNYSGKYISYYSNGNIKEIGYLSKIPRMGASESEVNINPCIMQNNKKIGTWYFFNENGQMTKIAEYDFCGNQKVETDTKKVEKENSKFQGAKEKYNFDFKIKM